MAVVGYARVSSSGQSLTVQLDKLKRVNCDKIFQEKMSGTTAARPQLQQALDYVREGDVVVITKLDRLARSTLHLHQIVNKLNDKGVGFRVLDQDGINTVTKEGKLMFAILASIAEFETELRKERQLEGIARAKREGVSFGRKAKLSEKEVSEMRHKRSQGVLIRELMSFYGLSKASVYRLLQSD